MRAKDDGNTWSSGNSSSHVPPYGPLSDLDLTSCTRMKHPASMTHGKLILKVRRSGRFLFSSSKINNIKFPTFHIFIRHLGLQWCSNQNLQITRKEKKQYFLPSVYSMSLEPGLEVRYIRSLFHLQQVQQSVGAVSCWDTRHNISFVLCKW